MKYRSKGILCKRIDPEAAFEALKEFPECRTEGVTVADMVKEARDHPDLYPKMAAILAAIGKNNRARGITNALDRLAFLEAGADSPRLRIREGPKRYRPRASTAKDPERSRTQRKRKLGDWMDRVFVFYVVFD